MNLKNKSFKDIKTGEIVRVVDSYNNVAITESKEKIDVRRLMDTNHYAEYIDPNSFFNDSGTYNIFAEQIKNVDLSKVPDDGTFRDPVTQVQAYSGLTPATNESAVIMSDPEYEVEELMRKYGATSVDSSALKRQNDAFSKLLAEDNEEVETKPNQVQQKVQPTVNRDVYREPDQPIRIEVEDPIITMFKNVKKNVNFSINIKVEGKIPRLDFIEMMEDSYETSIIEFLAEDFTNKLLSNPSAIRNQIIEEIKSKVYPLKNKKAETIVKDAIVEEQPQVVKKTSRGIKKNVVKDDTGTIS